ncbi:nuclear protein localization protein 4 [Phlyctochytrium bullatum]|nr:nuclear protein localization protein 4 [Phlyctochytrium bullatum]
MVDHVEFESASTVENFIQYWRQTGFQRFGYMFGRYEAYSEVPLGIKAVVSAIYEPPQDCGPDMIQLTLPDPKVDAIKKLGEMMGLEMVGMIYTDLLDDGTSTGNVVCKRHEKSYFLSSAECIMSAEMQDAFPHRTRHSPSGRFGSRFVTCVISGNVESQIDISCYQVSNVGMALTRDEVIEASTEPSLLRVKASDAEHYVPEVFYKYKNKYGLMVQEAAKPTCPVEYLLVTLSHGFPQEPKPLFLPSSFPTENRDVIEPQSMAALKRALDGQNVIDSLSNFHVVSFISGTGILDDADMADLIRVVQQKSEDAVSRLLHRPSWQTLQAILSETEVQDNRGAASSSNRGPWTCPHCTFVNIRGDTCEVCGLPAA